MRIAIGLVAMAACASDPDPTVTGVPDDDSANFDAIDLVIVPHRAFAYAHGLGGDVFPAIGECAAFSTDAVVLGATCLESLAIDDVPLPGNGSVYHEPGANPFAAFVDVATSLHVVGCGQSIDVALHPGNEPAVASLVPTVVGDDLRVAWDAPDAASVLVAAYGGPGCHTATTGDHVFAGFGSAMWGVEAYAFRAPEITATALGPIRVWYGSYASANASSN